MMGSRRQLLSALGYALLAVVGGFAGGVVSARSWPASRPIAAVAEGDGKTALREPVSIVDRNGNTRAEFDGGRMFFYDKVGNLRGMLDTDAPFLTLNGGHGHASVLVGVNALGEAAIYLSDDAGTRRAEFSLDAQGYPALRLNGSDELERVALGIQSPLKNISKGGGGFLFLSGPGKVGG